MNANVAIINRCRYFSREENTPILPIPNPARIMGPMQQLEAKMAAAKAPASIYTDFDFISSRPPHLTDWQVRLCGELFLSSMLAQTLDDWTFGDFL